MFTPLRSGDGEFTGNVAGEYLLDRPADTTKSSPLTCPVRILSIVR